MTLLSQGWPLKDGWWKEPITVIGIPTILSFFAYTYVIGYFVASDIAWFPFFTLSEHVLFAIRALPLAAAASIVFLTVYPNWERYGWLPRIWFWVLVAFAVSVLLTNHLIIAVIIGLMAFFEFIRRRDKDFIQPPKILYWAVNLMVLSTIAGFVSATIWMFVPLLHLPSTPWMIIELKNPLAGRKDNTLVGHAMFAGETKVLFYERSVGTHLLRFDDIQHIEECLHFRLTDDHRACLASE
jgi:hypothetical protein